MSPETLNPIKLVILQGTPLCNLNCTYCDLSPTSRRTAARMGVEVIERLFRELFASPYLAAQVTIVWHSGEPLTLSVRYYETAIETILRVRREAGRTDVDLRFDFQTNGVLIDQGWCDFFKRQGSRLNLGVSCDGPAHLHNAYRINWSGRATHAKTLAGMDLLQKNSIKYNIIAVISRETLRWPDAFYQFFHARRDYLTGFHFNVLAQADGPEPDLSYTHSDRQIYNRFFRRLLTLSREADAAGEPFPIRNFSQGLARIVASQASNAPSYLEEAGKPLSALNVDARGYVTTFYAGLGPEVARDLYNDDQGLSLGNIMETPLQDMVASEKLSLIVEDFGRCTASCRRDCDYASVCTGGFELTQRLAFGRYVGGETPECVIAIKALTDALLEDIGDHLDRVSSAA